MPSRLIYLPNPGRGQVSWSEAALRVASRRAKFIPPLEAEGFLWLFCNDLQRDSSKGGLLAYWLAPTATLCFHMALSATLCLPALNFLSAPCSQSIGFRKLATV